MKKCLCMLLALALVLTGCAAEPQKPELPEETVTSILSDWFDLLFASEYIYGDMLWVLSYVERFQEDQSWENLHYARMALWSAQRYTEKRGKAEASLTDEEYTALTAEGFDLSFIPVELHRFEKGREEVLSNQELLYMQLYDNAFWKHSLTALFGTAEALRVDYEAELGTLAVSTDYLLSVLGESETSARFETLVAESCPRIQALRMPGAGEEELKAAYNEFVDRMQALAETSSEVTGQYQLALDLLNQALKNDDRETMAQNSSAIDGLPATLPTPFWNREAVSDSLYFWIGEDGSHTYPVEGQVLTRPADGYTAIRRDVSQRDFDVYLTYVEYLGFPRTVLADEGDVLGSLFDLGAGKAEFIWKDGDVTMVLEGDVFFVPTWYINANGVTLPRQ